MKPKTREAKRYLGLELSGAKNQKTALAVLEYYPRAQKTFLLDIHDRITEEKLSADESLIKTILDLAAGEESVMGVNVPLTLPPCFECSKKTCRPGGKCTQPAVRWMREITQKASRQHRSSGIKALDFTSYTQRPIELWVRYSVLPKLQIHERFEIDETLGGNKAPLAARMHFLKRHLDDLRLIEAWPKLSIALLASELGLSKRTVSSYRKLEEGIHAREEILDEFTRKCDIFIYERDVRKLAVSLSSFDAFVCAYTAMLSDLRQTAETPEGFPVSSGWVEYPKQQETK